MPVYENGPRGTLTQALMELGAMVCAPNGAPRCGDCPLKELCLANVARHRGGSIPRERVSRKSGSARRKRRFFIDLARTALPSESARAGDFWQGCVGASERGGKARRGAGAMLVFVEDAGCEPAELLKSVERVHVFTHIIWRMRCYYMVCRRKSPEFVWADAQRRHADVALPTAFRMFSRNKKFPAELSARTFVSVQSADVRQRRKASFEAARRWEWNRSSCRRGISRRRTMSK